MGFIFNGISSQSMKIRARLTGWQASPPLRNAFEVVPGKAGIADFGTDTAERKIQASCNILPQRSFAQLVSVLDNMSAWLNPENGLKQLVFDDIPDRYFMARISEAIDCNRLLRTAGVFELNFICPDPFGYALVDESYTFSSTGSQQLTRTKGNLNSEPVYSLKGTISGSGSYISIVTNGEELKIVGTLAVNEILVIDTGKVTAKVTDLGGNTLRNGLPCLQELNFPTLNVGSNAVVISAVGASFTELKISAKSRWR